MHTPLSSSATIKSGLGIFVMGIASVALLNACGGGDPVKVPTTTTTTTPKTFITSSSSATPTVSITALTPVRYLIQGPSFSKEGTTTAFTYDGVRAMTSIDNHSIAATAGTYAVQEFMGGANLAQGRWTKGLPTLNGVVSSTPLTGTDSTAVHYLVMRDLALFTPGTYTCGRVRSDLRSTGLTYSGTTDATPPDTQLVGGMVPYATISVNGGGAATVSLQSIQVAGGGLLEEGYPNQTLTFASPSDGPKYLDGYQDGNEGAAFVLGQDTNAANITLGVAYRRAMSNGARYKGMTSVICSPP